jgi:alpha-amylase
MAKARHSEACFLMLFAFGSQLAAALPAKDWKRRAIYQVITDRFALEPGKTETCDEKFDKGQECKYGNYCGGSFVGIMEKLDYIQGMGFDAIWISPVVENTACGYHGYWTLNLHKINANFGGEKGLKAFVDAAHARGIAVMFDSVVNHVGPGTVQAAKTSDYSMYAPFDKKEYYHGDYMSHDVAEQAPLKGGQYVRETGWMGYSAELPDLAQEKPEVARILVDWVKSLKEQYQIDGFRMDALPYVNKTFYQLLKKEALGDTFATGEVVIGGKGIAFSANYQFQDPAASDDDSADHVEGPVIDSVINYDLSNALEHVFKVKDPSVPSPPIHGPGQLHYGQPVAYYVSRFQKAQKTFKDVGALANFVSVHDQPRWLYLSPDWRTYKNAYIATFFVPGIPIQYYGDEQGIRGSNDDMGTRSPLWWVGYNQTAPLYLWTKAMIAARKKMLYSLEDDEIDNVQHMTASDYSFSFQRGSAVVVVERVLPASVAELIVNVETSYDKGTVLCDSLEGEYCVSVGEGGVFEYTLSGWPKVLFPSSKGELTSMSASATPWMPATIGTMLLMVFIGSLAIARHHTTSAQDKTMNAYLSLSA